MEASLRVPDRINITIEVGGQPTVGMLVILKFLTARKNPYELAFGPSNERGTIEVSRDQILSEARKVVDVFPTDYWNIEVDSTGLLRVTPMNRESLDRALSAFRLYRGGYDYGTGYQESLRAADHTLAQRGEAEMTVTVQFDAQEPVTIETVRVAAAG
jgi:hypothetical protein